MEPESPMMRGAVRRLELQHPSSGPAACALLSSVFPAAASPFFGVPKSYRKTQIKYTKWGAKACANTQARPHYYF